VLCLTTILPTLKGDAAIDLCFGYGDSGGADMSATWPGADRDPSRWRASFPGP
jgi:hypothetical protein